MELLIYCPRHVAGPLLLSDVRDRFSIVKCVLLHRELSLAQLGIGFSIYLKVAKNTVKSISARFVPSVTFKVQYQKSQTV